MLDYLLVFVKAAVDVELKKKENLNLNSFLLRCKVKAGKREGRFVRAPLDTKLN